ncbi:MAG TPA: AMP-binding protein [Acidimicrobiales bacterium]|nr:AMP-binding protein [Acidimicrobiales bacterium]
MNLGRLLTNSAQRFPDRPAVTWGDRSLTYGALERRTNALAHGLARLGVAKGDRVGVLMRNRPELLEAMFACFKAGYCLVPLNSRFTAEEVAYHVEDSGAVAVLTDVEGAPVVNGAGLAGVTVVVAGDGGDLPGGALRHEDLVAGDESPAVVDVDRDDLAWLFYTSGTTGRPKGAMLTHGVLGFVTASWLADLTPIDEHDVTLHAAPLTHGAGFHALAATARAAHQVIPTGASFDPPAILDLMRRAGVTNTWLVPTQIVMLVDAVGDGRPGLTDLRYVVYGGAPFAPADLRAALETFGPVFVQLFGQGETPMTATVLSIRDHAAALAGDRPERLASAGVARPGTDVRVLGDGDRDLAPGEVGEVCVRGGAVMLGYWSRPEATAETLRNGWLHTGDLGRMDDHGYLYLLDRAKDLIISGGSNVYAVEVEAVLADHPGVVEVAVVGLADRTWGEVVTAVVVADDGGDRDGLEAELGALCRTRLAGYKRPRRFAFVGALPRNAYGKVLKRELRAALADA